MDNLNRMATGFAWAVGGSGLAYVLDSSAWMIFINGFIWAQIWLVGVGTTREYIHDRHIRWYLKRDHTVPFPNPELWLGWKWNDYLWGSLGSFVGCAMFVFIGGMR